MQNRTSTLTRPPKHALLLAVFATAPLAMQTAPRYEATFGGTSPEFGRGFSVSGETLAIGETTLGASPPPAVHVFVRNGTSWSKEAELLPLGHVDTDRFGSAVALEGDTLMVGAPYDDGHGSVYVFVRNSGAWAETQTLVASDAAAGDLFGAAIAIDGNHMIIGAPQDDGSGSAYVFVRLAGAWIPQQKLSASIGVAGETFGASVAISGTRALVGAGGQGAGRAFVFVRSQTSWTEEAELQGSNAAAGDAFGNSVAISGGTALIGAPYADQALSDSGCGYLFELSGVWQEQGKLVSAFEQTNGRFGYAVALHANLALVGATGERSSAGNGTAYFFERDGLWNLNQTWRGPHDGGMGAVLALDSEALAIRFDQPDGAGSVDVHGLYPPRFTVGTTRASKTSAGSAGNGTSLQTAVSGNGRFVAYASDSVNLGYVNGLANVYLHDLWTGANVQVNLLYPGPGPPDGNCQRPAISFDGRFVVFESDATNLGSGPGIILWDRLDGYHGSPQGFTSVSVDSNGVLANGLCTDPTISGDGRFVLFSSDATNLVLNDTNGKRDLFLRDTQTGITTRVNVDSAGNQANGSIYTHAAISHGGTQVVFASWASNLVAGDTNGFPDVFLRDVLAGTTTRISVGPVGQQANGVSSSPSISASGAVIAFDSLASNLVYDMNGQRDIFVRAGGYLTRATWQANGPSFRPSVSPDGRWVAFDSVASTLVPGDTNGKSDVFLYDHNDLHVSRLSVDSAGVEGNDSSTAPSLSAFGELVGFTSLATNLDPTLPNGNADVFAHGRCEIYFEPFGQGFAGTGNQIPDLQVVEGSCTGYSMAIQGGLGGSIAAFVGGVGEIQLPFLGGLLYVDPRLSYGLKVLALSGPAGVPGAGSALVPTLPSLASFRGSTLIFQVLVIDPGGPAGWSMSRGWRMKINN